MGLHTSPFARPHHDRGPIYRLDPSTKIASFLPNATNLHLRVEITGGIEWHAHPKLVRINAVALRFLDTNFSRVCISIAHPKLQVFVGGGISIPTTANELTEAAATVVAEDFFPPIAPLAAYYARIQRALVQLAGHLSRHSGALKPPPAGLEEEKKHWPSSQENCESQYWWVSEHMMHPCEDYEAASGGDDEEEEGEYEITDRMVERGDDGGGEWCVVVTRLAGGEEEREKAVDKQEEEQEEKEEEEEKIHLHNTGLRYFRVTKQAQDQDNLDPPSSHIFKRDAIPKFGAARSWSCASTGDVAWVEDGENAVTGWLLSRRNRDDETGREGEVERRLIIAEPAQPSAA